MSPTPASPAPNNTPTARRPSSSSSTAASTLRCAAASPAPNAGAASPRASTPTSAPTRSGRGWPPTSMRPPAPAPTCPHLLTDAVDRHGPLPDELPAAALWWRLAGTLEPPTLAAANTGLRPAWTPELHRLLGSRIAETVIADPAWPSLVAAVAASGWQPRDLLAAAAEHLRDIARNRTPAARRIRAPADLPRRTAHPPRRHHRRRHPPPRRSRRAIRPRRARRAARPVHRPRRPVLTSRRPTPTTTPTATPKTPSTALDFTDLPRHRPSPRRRASTPTSPPLRAQRDAAHATRCPTGPGDPARRAGPAETAAADELAELHERHQQQRHHQHDLAHAHGDWVSAEHTAEIHRALLDQLAAQISAAERRRRRRPGRHLSHPPRRAGPATPPTSTPPSPGARQPSTPPAPPCSR